MSQPTDCTLDLQEQVNSQKALALYASLPKPPLYKTQPKQLAKLADKVVAEYFTTKHAEFLSLTVNTSNELIADQELKDITEAKKLLLAKLKACRDEILYINSVGKYDALRETDLFSVGKGVCSMVSNAVYKVTADRHSYEYLTDLTVYLLNSYSVHVAGSVEAYFIFPTKSEVTPEAVSKVTNEGNYNPYFCTLADAAYSSNVPKYDLRLTYGRQRLKLLNWIIAVLDRTIYKED